MMLTYAFKTRDKFNYVDFIYDHTFMPNLYYSTTLLFKFQN